MKLIAIASLLLAGCFINEEPKTPATDDTGLDTTDPVTRPADNTMPFPPIEE